MTEILWTFIGLIRDILGLLSPRLAKWFYSLCKKILPAEEEKAREPEMPQERGIKAEVPREPTPAAPPKEEAVITTAPTPEPELTTTREETLPYIDRGPSLPEHYGEDRIIALTKDPRCIFVYWDLKGSEDRETVDYYKEAKSWFLRVHHLGEDTYYDVPVHVDAWDWYLLVEDDKTYTVDLGFNTQYGKTTIVATSNPAHTPRAGTSHEHTEQWAFIFDEAESAAPGGVGKPPSRKRRGGRTEGVDIEWIFHAGLLHEGWLEAHVAGSTPSQTHKKG